MSIPVVYCLNGFQWLWRYLMTSIRMLQRFDYGKEEIVVFYGPPRYERQRRWLEPNCVIRDVEVPLHSNHELRHRILHKNSFYGSTMKIHAFGVETEAMFWMDSDTEIFADLRDILKLEYDIIVGEVPHYGHVMEKPSREAGLPEADVLYYAGFWGTKHHTHQRIRGYYVDYWERCFQNEFSVGSINRLELYAFNLAVQRFRHEDGGNVVVMPKNWQGYEGTVYVCHLHRNEFSPWEKAVLTKEERGLFGVGMDDRSWLERI